MCGKAFGSHENSYLGHTENGMTVYVCESCSKNINDAHIYTNSHNRPNTIPAPDAKLWRYMDLFSDIYFSMVFISDKPIKLASTN